MNYKQNIRYILILISLCGLIGAVIGLCTNVAGLFFSPIAEELGLLRGSVAMTLTINNLVMAVTGLLAGRILREKNFRPILISGITVLVASTALMSSAHSVSALYFLNALRGFAGGFLGFVLVTLILNSWFVRNNGLVTSIAFGMSGIAGAVFSPIVSSVIQNIGWRRGYLAISAVMLVFCLPALFFLPSLAPAACGMAPYGASGGAGQPENEQKWLQEEAKKEYPVTLLLLLEVGAYAVFTCASTALPQFFPGIAESADLTAAIGAGMISCCMIANTGGKIFIGILTDRFGTKVSCLICVGVSMTALFLILFVPYPAFMLLGAALFGLVYSAASVAVVMITRDTFGVGNYGKVYPAISLSGTLASAVFSTIIGYMYDFTGGYVMTIWLIVLMLVSSMGLITVLYRKRNEKADEKLRKRSLIWNSKQV